MMIIMIIIIYHILLSDINYLNKKKNNDNYLLIRNYCFNFCQRTIIVHIACLSIK